MAVVHSLIAARLWNERLVGSALTRPEDVVSWLGAVQAQEYGPARWGLAQRMTGATDAAIQGAFDEGRILRTHVLRPTWHFVTPADIRWILRLSAPRVHTINGHPYRTNSLTPRVLARGTDVIARALEGHRHLTRQELAAVLRRARLPAQGQALAYVVMHAELEGVICSGPRRGRQFTYALLDERVPPADMRSGDEALAELTRRYFTSRGPATLRDFVWWSGLTVAQARAGISALGDVLERREFDDRTFWSAAGGSPPRLRGPGVHLLPIYDEFLIAFKDREWAAPTLGRPPASLTANTYFHHLVVDGRVEGWWNQTSGAEGATVDVRPYGRLSPPIRTAIHAAARRYEAFLQTPVSVSIGE